MKLPPKDACPDCHFFIEIIAAILASLDLVAPDMDAAVAAKDKPKAIHLRDEVLKFRGQLVSTTTDYAQHLAEHESISN